MSIIRTAAAVLALSTAAFSAPAFSAPAFSAPAEQVGESASPSTDFVGSIMVSQGEAGAGRAGNSASSATGNPLAYDMPVSRSHMTGLESSIALSNNASAQDDGSSVAYGARRLAAR